jgi:hypothetical protein
MESKANKKGGDENLALFGQTNKGKGKGPVTILIHTYLCGEVSNPLGVSLEAQA